MSDEAESAYERKPRGTRRTRVLVFGVIGVILAFFLVTTFASFYTDHLWYASVGYTGVFDTLLWTRLGLFALFGVLVGGAVAGNMLIAYRARPFFRPDSPEQSGLDRYRDAVTPIRTLLWVSISLVVGLFAGVASSGHWRTYLLWRNRGSFGTQDPYFHRDVGFYVFTLPWLHFLVGIVIAALVLAAIVASVVHYLYGGIRLQVVQDRMSRTAQVQLSVLIGLLLLVKAFGYWLDRFDLVTGGGKVSTGMSYTDYHAVLPARNILVGVAVICAILFFANAWRRSWLLPGMGVSLLLVTSILLGLIWPAIVQHFQVNPSEPAKEASYLQTNIAATRAAYGLNDILAKPYKNGKVSSATVQELIDQTNAVPLVDPALSQKAFQQIQQAQSYYSVAQVLDVDHYPIDGGDRALVLGVRELNQSGIPSADQGWSNLHTVYTHGNGIIAAFGNQRPANDFAQSDQMQWAQGQDPGQDSLEKATGPFQSQIYFGQDGPDYSIVGKLAGAPDVELDLTGTSTTTNTTYAGGGGVGVGGFFHKLMYAVKFGDPNFVLSQRVNANSQVLYNRDPAQRVEKVAPWLTLDSDVYPAVVDGHVLWVVDGYTTTNRYPQSERGSFSEMTDDALSQSTGVQTVPTDDINYMRNSVKATVDAYTGQVRLYAWDESDPILRAWTSAFPGTVLSKDEIPTDLMPHLRYPEDYFKVQRYQYARYHVTDANDLYQANNTWDVSLDPNPVIKDQFQAPVRMFARDPDTGQLVWSLTSNYVPHNKNNLVGLLTADSDATSADYGQLKVELAPDQNTQGPGQVVNALISNPHISKKTQSFRLGDATPSYGNLLTVPLNSGVMYVEPVYASRAATNSSTYLTLRYVMVAYGDKVGIGKTLLEALADMVGTKAPPTTGGGNDNPPSGGGSKKATALLAAAERHFEAADTALKAGKASQWVRLTHEARQEVAQALNLLQ